MLFALLLLAFQCIAFTQDGPSALTRTELSEVSKLKAENHKLKIQLTQCRVTLSDRETRLLQAELSSERAALEAEYRKELKADEKKIFNWDTLTFTDPPETK